MWSCSLQLVKHAGIAITKIGQRSVKHARIGITKIGQRSVADLCEPLFQ
jgi:hypothetical protein